MTRPPRPSQPTPKPADTRPPSKPVEKPHPMGPRRIGLPAWLAAAFRVEQEMTVEQTVICDIAAGRFQ